MICLSVLRPLLVRRPVERLLRQVRRRRRLEDAPGNLRQGGRQRDGARDPRGGGVRRGQKVSRITKSPSRETGPFRNSGWHDMKKNSPHSSATYLPTREGVTYSSNCSSARLRNTSGCCRGRAVTMLLLVLLILACCPLSIRPLSPGEIKELRPRSASERRKAGRQQLVIFECRPIRRPSDPRGPLARSFHDSLSILRAVGCAAAALPRDKALVNNLHLHHRRLQSSWRISPPRTCHATAATVRIPNPLVVRSQACRLLFFLPPSVPPPIRRRRSKSAQKDEGR